jgi:hypothetical protein
LEIGNPDPKTIILKGHEVGKYGQGIEKIFCIRIEKEPPRLRQPADPLLLAKR